MLFLLLASSSTDLFRYKAKANYLGKSLINVVKTLCDGRGQWSEVVLPRETRVGGNRAYPRGKLDGRWWPKG